MFRLSLGYPSADEEREMINRLHTIEEFKVSQVASAENIRQLTRYVENVYINDDVKSYLVDLVRKTRDMKELTMGGSPRALIHLTKACRARALVKGRDYVIPDDVKELIEPSLNHRMWLSRDSEIEGLKISDILRRIVDETPIPGTREVGHT
jgi:MoxR-like ATPase